MPPTLFRNTLNIAWPILVAQLTLMLMPIADTVMAGHYGTTDLAAVALGNSLYITVFLTLSGILQSLAPTFAHHHGAKRSEAIRDDFQQGVWLAATLGLIGVAILSQPRWLLGWTDADPAVLDKATSYLRAISLGLPAVLLYKVASSLFAATGHQRMLMWVSLGAVALNIPLNVVLMWGYLGLPEMGARGCGLATAIAMSCNVLLAFNHLARGKNFQHYALFQNWKRPDFAKQRELLKLGTPIAFSLLVEISAFTLISLFVARLGPEVIGGHRIASQMAGLCYMLPLALGSATAVLVGQACGARDFPRARQSAIAGAILASTLATALGLVILLAREPIAQIFSNDAAVLAIAENLMIFIALYQFFDGVQTIGTFALRGYKVTLTPLFIHVFCFWLIGLGGGYWLAFHEVAVAGIQLGPSGAAGFWGASVASTIAAAILLGGLMHKVSREREREFAPPAQAQ